jgi:hypothetical protein
MLSADSIIIRKMLNTINKNVGRIIRYNVSSWCSGYCQFFWSEEFPMWDLRFSHRWL